VDAHKWNQAVAVVGGSAGMTGAPTMTATAALRAGAGYAVMAMVGGAVNAGPTEAVATDLGTDTDEVLARIGRCRAMAIGPGADTDHATTELLARVVDALSVSAVFDAGALRPELLDRRRSGGLADDPLHVLTPHDGEFERLTGHKPGEDRVAATRSAAESLRAVVVLKGPTTVIAHPDGRAYVSVAGDQRLATAGTGDVLTGVIAAGLALGLDPFDAAGLGVELHGRAARLGHPTGLIATDLPDLVAVVLSSRSVGDERSSRARAGGSLGR
jgi:NAD(P)H-hydrate epimerase